MSSISTYWRRRLVIVTVGAGLAGMTAARAQSADALLDKLVEKGVLTTDEAGELRDQTDKDFAKAYQVKSGMPDWVTTFRIGGDFRARYEGFYFGDASLETVNRFRYRARIAFTAVIQDNFEVGVRLASGNFDNASSFTTGADPISNNQTFQNNASKKGVFIDLAYMKWSPLNTPQWSGAFTVGKMENPFFFSDMVFDNDYTPEGFAQTVAYRLNDHQTLNFTAGQFILDEIGSSSGGVVAAEDPYLFGGQMLLNSIWTPKITSTLGAGYLDILNTQSLLSSAVPNINYGNERYTLYNNGATTLLQPVSDFRTLVANAAVTYSFEHAPMYAGVFPVSLTGEYMYNFGAASDQDTGYSVGITFGKAGKKGTWEVSYVWKMLGGDSWWEELTDSDFGAAYINRLPTPPPGQSRFLTPGYQSGPNTQGSVVKVSYSPYDFLTLSTKVFVTTLIQPYLPSSDSQVVRLQVDATIKF